MTPERFTLLFPLGLSDLSVGPGPVLDGVDERPPRLSAGRWCALEEGSGPP